MDVLGCETIREGGVSDGDSFLRARSDARGIGLIEKRLDSTLELLLGVEFENKAFKLHWYRRHFLMSRIHRCEYHGLSA